MKKMPMMPDEMGMPTPAGKKKASNVKKAAKKKGKQAKPFGRGY